jgi:hypothetical protein
MPNGCTLGAIDVLEVLKAKQWPNCDRRQTGHGTASRGGGDRSGTGKRTARARNEGDPHMSDIHNVGDTDPSSAHIDLNEPASPVGIARSNRRGDCATPLAPDVWEADGDIIGKS